jgi:hypothetical protein
MANGRLGIFTCWLCDDFSPVGPIVKKHLKNVLISKWAANLRAKKFQHKLKAEKKMYQTNKTPDKSGGN